METNESKDDETKDLIRRLCRPLNEATFWMQAVAIFGVLVAVLQCFMSRSYVQWGATFIALWMAALLFSAASRIRAAHYIGREQDMVAALACLRRYFKLMGIMAMFGVATAVGLLIYTGWTK